MKPEEIMRLSATERADVEEKAKGGDVAAIRDFVYVSAWRAILKDPYINPGKREEVFRALMDEIAVAVDAGLANG